MFFIQNLDGEYAGNDEWTKDKTNALKFFHYENAKAFSFEIPVETKIILAY